MKILEVSEVRKVYTTRFGANQVEALRSVSFSVEQNTWPLWANPAPARPRF